jgi:uncharacterized membrane protein YsdA (DUF1294 family)
METILILGIIYLLFGLLTHWFYLIDKGFEETRSLEGRYKTPLGYFLLANLLLWPIYWLARAIKAGL